MRYLFALALFVTSQVNAQEYWHPTEPGCYDQKLGDTLLFWEDAPTMSLGGVRIAIQPDTGNGPTRIVQIDPGHQESSGETSTPPFVLVAVGSGGKTCVQKTSLANCPAAATVLDRLHKQSIPIGFASDTPSPMTVMHGDTYYLDYRDGQGNPNQWRFYGLDHPLQGVIAESMQQLESCLTPVEHSLHGL